MIFERERPKVEAEVKRQGLDYPHLLDNDSAYWKALGARGLADGLPRRSLRPAARPSHRRGAFGRGQRPPGRGAHRGAAGRARGRLRRPPRRRADDLRPDVRGDARSFAHPARHPREGARRARPPPRSAQPLQPLLEGGRQGAVHRPARSAHRRLGPDRRPLRPALPDGIAQGRPRLLDPGREAGGRSVRARRAHPRVPLHRQLRHRRGLGRPAHGLSLAGRAPGGHERGAVRRRSATTGREVVATPGSESNVKEIYDKVRELRATPPTAC